MKTLLIAIAFSALAGSASGADSGIDRWIAAHEPRPATHLINQKDIPMRNAFVKAAMVAPLLYGAPHIAHAQPHARIMRAADEIQVAPTPQPAAPVTPAPKSPSPVSARGRLDTAIAAYKEAVTGYVTLLDKSAALEATAQKAQIKAELTGDTVAHSPEVQATYDAKDIAEAKMNAAETVMNSAIADMGGPVD
jgi:hypothetical protein